MADLLIRGGTVVDGTRAAPTPADVRVRDGLIAEVAPGLRPEGEAEIDAGGAFVTPGFLEPHAHIDGAMWWDPSLDPLPNFGATCVVFGNCGISVAPLAGQQRDSIVDLFCYLEDLPRVAFERQVPWTWETWPEYRKAADGHAMAANVAGYVGHLSLRTFVMGDAAWERAATPAEIGRMAEMLDAALQFGALGLSTNQFDKDRLGRPVPSRFAADDEYEALIGVLGRHRRTTLQAIIRFDDPDPIEFKADVRRLASICGRHRVRGQWTAIPSGVVEADRRADARELHREFRSEGIDFWPMQPHMASHMFWNFERSLVYFRIPAWNEVINGPTELKLPTLADPAWRDKARWDWEHRQRSTNARIEFPHNLIFAVSETGAGPLGISLTDYANQLGVHISDALAEWICNNGLGSMLRVVPDEFDDEAVVTGIRDPHILTNINDTGAHLQLFCGAGQNVHMLTHYVRDLEALSIEEAVHSMTGKAAEFFGFGDRGVVAEGKAADLAVFALDEIELPGEVKSYDVPGGSWRFTRPSAGFRATIVAGTPTFADGAPTGALPGRMIGPN